MTTAEVADYLRLKERTVYEMVSKNQIPCSRATGKLLFSRSLIDAWVESHTEMPLGQRIRPPAICAGPNEPLLEWALRQSGSGLAVLTNGSRDGLDSLARGKAVLSGVNLWDPETQTYNVEQVRSILPQSDIVVVHWARRVQGLIVPADNPMQIQSLADVVKNGFTIARQKSGSGSRILLSELLRQENIAPEDVRLSEVEAETDEDLCGMIVMGEADCALGVEAAARSLGFIPLWHGESFDVVMRRRDYFEPAFQKLLAFAASREFSRQAEYFRGYDIADLGAIRYNG